MALSCMETLRMASNIPVEWNCFQVGTVESSSLTHSAAASPSIRSDSSMFRSQPQQKLRKRRRNASETQSEDLLCYYTNSPEFGAEVNSSSIAYRYAPSEQCSSPRSLKMSEASPPSVFLSPSPNLASEGSSPCTPDVPVEKKQRGNRKLRSPLMLPDLDALEPLELPPCVISETPKPIYRVRIHGPPVVKLAPETPSVPPLDGVNEWETPLPELSLDHDCKGLSGGVTYKSSLLVNQVQVSNSQPDHSGLHLLEPLSGCGLLEELLAGSFCSDLHTFDINNLSSTQRDVVGQDVC